MAGMNTKNPKQGSGSGPLAFLRTGQGVRRWIDSRCGLLCKVNMDKNLEWL